MRNILLIEDDIQLQELIQDYLHSYNYICNSFSHPREALKEFAENFKDYSLVILDLNLPEMDGFDLFKKLKKIYEIPIIISTARGDIGNKIFGFELGADDYLAKPYDPRELVLRIDSTLKKNTSLQTYTVSDFTICEQSHSVYLNNKLIEFTKVEYEIFLFFIKNRKNNISRESLIDNSTLNHNVKDRVVDTHIKNIRIKIDDDAKKPKYIKSVWEIGYSFVG